MRFALTLLLAILAPVAFAADILVLVHEKDAGPRVPPGSYRQPTWVLWPHSSNLLQTNLFYSLPSGVDWQANHIVDAFVIRETIAESTTQQYLVDQGFFQAVADNLGKRKVYALIPKTGKPTTETLRAAWTQPESVPLLSSREEWPSDALVVASVSGPNPWDEKAALVRKAGGRAVILEIPNSPFQTWGRLWFEGRGWPEGVPNFNDTHIPGLIPARHAMALLSNPSIADWRPNGPPDPPDRWLAFGHETAPVVLVFLAIASLYVLGLSVFYVLREQYSRLALTLLRLMVLSPAALILGGRLTSFGPIGGWPLWHVAAIALLALFAFALNRIASRWFSDCHPLWSEFAAGLFVVAAIDPAWSMFSQVLGEHPAKISPEAFGAVATYGVGASCLFGGSRLQSAVWSIVWVGGAAALLYASGWVPVSPIFIALLAIPLLQPVIHDVKVLAALIGFFLILTVMSSRGICYAPNGLISHLYDKERINFAEHVAFFFSPMFIGFAVALVVIGIVGDNFLGHQVRRAMAFSPKPKTFLYAGGTFGAIGLACPIYLHAALATAIAGGVTMLFDAVRTP